MAPMRQDVKASAVKYKQEGRSILEIQKLLRTRHGCKVSRQGLYKLLQHGSITRRNSLLSREKIQHLHRRCIHMWMCQNNELTASAIKIKLRNVFSLDVSLSTINTVRRNLGWTSNTGKYCQQISHVNKRLLPTLPSIPYFKCRDIRLAVLHSRSDGIRHLFTYDDANNWNVSQKTVGR
uniref:Uncharacterized protein n=1 Tax=Magallana gigas TaxID=29159 RepID=A0A8W8MAP1_MAGGI